jgi:hypothetical protein
VFKAGVLKKAKMLFDQGNYAETITTLAEGFNFVSIRLYFEEEERKALEKKAKANRKELSKEE